MFYYQIEFLDFGINLAATDRGFVRTGFSRGVAPKQDGAHPPWFRQAAAILQRYLDGSRVDLSRLPIDWERVTGTDFQKRVWHACRRIAYGQVQSYAWVAQAADCSRGYRAVGQALGKNPLLLLVPCHRVVAKKGIGGFSSGLDRKRMLLALEQVPGYST